MRFVYAIFFREQRAQREKGKHDRANRTRFSCVFTSHNSWHSTTVGHHWGRCGGRPKVRFCSAFRLFDKEDKQSKNASNKTKRSTCGNIDRTVESSYIYEPMRITLNKRRAERRYRRKFGTGERFHFL